MDDLIVLMRGNDKEAVEYILPRLYTLKRTYLRYMEEPHKGELDEKLISTIHKCMMHFKGETYIELVKFVKSSLKNAKLDYIETMNFRRRAPEIDVKDMRSSIDCYPIENLLGRVYEKMKKKNVRKVFKTLINSDGLERLLKINKNRRESSYSLNGGKTVRMLKEHIAGETELTIPTVSRCIEEIVDIVGKVSREAEHEFN